MTKYALRQLIRAINHLELGFRNGHNDTHGINEIEKTFMEEYPNMADEDIMAVHTIFDTVKAATGAERTNVMNALSVLSSAFYACPQPKSESTAISEPKQCTCNDVSNQKFTIDSYDQLIAHIYGTVDMMLNETADCVHNGTIINRHSDRMFVNSMITMFRNAITANNLDAINTFGIKDLASNCGCIPTPNAITIVNKTLDFVNACTTEELKKLAIIHIVNEWRDYFQAKRFMRNDAEHIGI